MAKTTISAMHQEVDIALATWFGAKSSEVKKYFVIQEREISYRFTLHQHPYIQHLTQQLLQSGIPGLQAADTEYKPGGATRPDSVEIELDDAVAFTIAPGARLALRKSLRVADGAPFDLGADLGLKLAATAPTRAAAAAPPGGVARLRATLIEGVALTTLPGAPFTLPNGSRALVRGNTLITLKTPAPVLLAGGATLTLPAGTELALSDDAEISLPDGTSARLVRSKRLPVLFAPALAGYGPTALVERPYAAKDLDFSYGGAYSVYNWELFYHAPLTIAMHLSKNGRFAEAQRWFHYLFDPTDNSDGPTPERFWKVLPFHTTDVKKVEEILLSLTSDADPDLRDETVQSINAWKASPFRPHVVARYRQQAYMFKTVMAYLDNLIAWGDSLFRQDTGEAIDEALMLYVLARNILGPRPQAVPAKGSIRPQTYHNLREDLRHFGSVVRDLEAAAPFDLMPLPAADSDDGAGLATVRGLGKALYFCVPRNDKLLGYWDTVDDRLFKIRNSLNFQGTFRQLALFEPPIDPALLARAAAAGLNVAAIVNGLNQPLPLVRFQLLAQKAAELVQEVKALGSSLLAAMEKEDGEALASLRARHERAMLEMVEQVRYAQWQEAIKASEGLLASLALAVQRYSFYELQLGKSADEIQKAIPALSELDKSGLEKMKFAAGEPAMLLRELVVDIAQDLGEAGGKLVSSHEADEMKKLADAQDERDSAGEKERIGAGLGLIPNFGAHVQPLGPGGSISFGGANLAGAMSFWASFGRAKADTKTFESANSAKVGSYARRELEWAFQSNLTAGEIAQIFKQLRAAQIREAIAELELRNHRKQIANAKEIEQFLNEEGTAKQGKKTNKALYTWMKREAKGLYAQCFQFAFDIAKKAERALQHELGDPALSYLQFGYLAGKEGLLAGEKLFLDLRRMEMAYLELNRREYELTRHVSLLQVDPMALIRLRASGRCTVQLPEALFDMDGPGHYFRRIKTVALSLPCVAGPYASVNCTLTLLKSSIRTTAAGGGPYARAEGGEDSRFQDYFGSTQAIVTSAALNDSGLFELNMRDERYLPFELAGAISEWQLELPANPSAGDPTQFDYQTISDVILHIRYTAREGGGPLRSAALAALKERMAAAQALGSVRLFSLRHEFPAAWAAFQNQQPGQNKRYELTLNLDEKHYPFWSKGQLNHVASVEVVARSSTVPIPPSVDIFQQAEAANTSKRGTLVQDAALGELLVGKFDNAALPARPLGALTLYFNSRSFSDVWMAVAWAS